MNNLPSVVTLLLKNGENENVSINKVRITTDWFNVNDLMNSGSLEFLLEIKHSGLTTLLNLTDTTPYMLLHFDETGLFLSVSFSIKKGTGSFFLQTQSRNILLVRFPFAIPIQQIKNFIL
jgi:hypothetical protein